MGTRIRGAIERTRQRRRTQRDLASQQEAIRKADSATYQSPHRNPFSDTSRENYRTYPYDYYSGTDCKVFYGDVWVDDIVAINYNVSQNKTPIYGYASQNFNAVAKGQVIVQGTLTIAFKETGYLNIIQRITETQKQNAYEVIKRRRDISVAKSDYKLAKFDPSINYFGEQPKNSRIAVGTTPNGSPQIIRQEQTIEEILMDKKSGNNISLALSEQYDLSQKSRDFEDFAELLEDSIWGDSNGRPLGKELRNSIKRADEFDYNPRGGVKVGIGEGDSALYDQTLNIMLTFGDINDFRAEHTIIVLNDVHFTGTTQMVSPDGSPVAEEYSFFARDINRSISSEILNSIDPIKLDVGIDDLQLARLEDIDSIEEKLNQASTDTPWVLSVKPVASFNNFGWTTEDGETLEVYLSMNKGAPLVDRMIEAVEKALNDSQFADYIDTGKQQYIIDTWFTPTETITMVVEQSIPNTRTYKVIAPVRTGFRAPVIVKREDFFTDVSELPEPLEEIGGILDRNRKVLEDRDAKLEEARSELDREYAALGTEDERDLLRRRTDERYRREDQLEEADTALGERIRQRQLDRAFKKELEARVDLAEEQVSPLEQRDLNRGERDRLADLTDGYDRLAKETEALSKDEFINQQALRKYVDNISEQREQRRKAYEQAHEENVKLISRMAAEDTEAEKARIISERDTEISKIDAQIAAANRELIELSISSKARESDKKDNIPQEHAPWYAQNNDTILYSENVESHASRAGDDNEAYRRGLVQAIDIQNSVGESPIFFPLDSAKVIAFSPENQAAVVEGNLPGVQGTTNLTLAHILAIEETKGGLIVTGSTADERLRTLRPLVHVQATNADYDFQSAITRAYQEAGKNVYDVDAARYYAAESLVEPITQWPNHQRNIKATEEKEEQKKTEGRTGIRVRYDSDGNPTGIIIPQ